MGCKSSRPRANAAPRVRFDANVHTIPGEELDASCQSLSSSPAPLQTDKHEEETIAHDVVVDDDTLELIGKEKQCAKRGKAAKQAASAAARSRAAAAAKREAYDSESSEEG